MSSSVRHLTVPILALTIAVLALRAGGGPLDPPAGPIAPTYKTLTEVEPRIPISAATTPGDIGTLFKITHAGSYYLTGNIAGVPRRSAIEIADSNVSIDLNGFTLTGPAAGDPTTGIRTTSSSQDNVEVRNGQVVGWTAIGITLTGKGSRVVSVLASDNAGTGINVGIAGVVDRCRSNSNGSNGISTASGSLVIDCDACANAFTGITSTDGTTVGRCTVRANGTGITMNAGGAIHDCTVFLQDAAGIVANFGCTITNCTAFANEPGIIGGSTVTITGCTVRSSIGDGIRVSEHCVVRGCTSSDNLGSGIEADGAANRIEDNACSNNVFGFRITGTRSVILRNTCTSSIGGNWSIAADNIYGPIIDRSTVATAAVNTDAAASALGSTDPNANYTH